MRKVTYSFLVSEISQSEILQHFFCDDFLLLSEHPGHDLVLRCLFVFHLLKIICSFANPGFPQDSQFFPVMHEGSALVPQTQHHHSLDCRNVGVNRILQILLVHELFFLWPNLTWDANLSNFCLGQTLRCLYTMRQFFQISYWCFENDPLTTHLLRRIQESYIFLACYYS